MEEVMKCLTELNGLIKNIDMRRIDDLPVEPVKPPKKLPDLPSEIIDDIIYKFQPRPDYINSLKWLFNVVENKDFGKLQHSKIFKVIRTRQFADVLCGGIDFIINGFFYNIRWYDEDVDDAGRFRIKNEFIVKYDLVWEEVDIHQSYRSIQDRNNTLNDRVMYLTGELPIKFLKHITKDKTIKKENKLEKVWKYYDIIRASDIGNNTLKRITGYEVENIRQRFQKANLKVNRSNPINNH